ncbi:uncharacterized protein L969DRAFT_20008 [Mixia osmundae IAM 14324]|uniref:Uncharacterized protein n=1 Tax=Mixia osmundae (strain CBS 9802 / IAM 14324 / JCM 22182 / KY 12970) TaxID=764103 RepID=G7E1F1_MIXOS|nr:uncharacterized protein L969DRAFT_20008 [Mixia osmundae IAM 14324]KEI36615.1 hypothetical protein L969DRAFT_20008 [Mixia osmundae IAM 14324]GAA96661.1 hypothetical protein E5Q_03332 [Mixia osmundae IAM 14324]
MAGGKAQAADKSRNITLVIVGDGGTGKSSCTLRFVRPDEDTFTQEYDPTVEDSYSATRTVDGQTWHVEVIDTAGQEEYQDLWQDQVVKQGDGFALVYDVASAASLDRLSFFLDKIRRVKCLEDRRPTSANTPENNPFTFVLMGNKCDLPTTQRQVTASQGMAFARAGGGLFTETSAKTNVNVQNAFDSLIRAVIRARQAQANSKAPINPNAGFLAQQAEQHQQQQEKQSSAQPRFVEDLPQTPRKKNPSLALGARESTYTRTEADTHSGGCKCIIS